MTLKFTPLVASLCAALSLGLGPAHASPPAREAAPASSDPETKVKIGLAIDTSEIAEEFRKQLELTTTRRLRPALEAAGYEVTDGIVDLAVRVRFTPVERGAFRDHGIYFDFIKGNEIERAIDWVLCNACGLVPLEEALDKVTPPLIEAVNKKVAQAPTPQVEDGGAEDGGDGDAGDGDGGSTEPIKRIGPLGFAGIGVAVVGLGMTIGGAVELSRARVFEQNGGFYDFSGKDHRPVGYVLVGVGAAATVAGLVMLGVDAGRRAKLHKQAQARVLIIPSLSPAHAGVGVVGRF